MTYNPNSTSNPCQGNYDWIMPLPQPSDRDSSTKQTRPPLTRGQNLSMTRPFNNQPRDTIYPQISVYPLPGGANIIPGEYTTSAWQNYGPTMATIPQGSANSIGGRLDSPDPQQGKEDAIKSPPPGARRRLTAALKKQQLSESELICRELDQIKIALQELRDIVGPMAQTINNHFNGREGNGPRGI